MLVNHHGLDSASHDLTTAAQRIGDRLAQLQHQLAPFAQDWAGSTRESYAAAQTAWNTALSDMQSLLAELGVAVDQANARYRDADLRGARLFGG